MPETKERLILMKNLFVILGPTGIGKTDASIQLAEHLNVPVINADSRQIFAEIPIGTAAPSKELLCRVKHYFVGNHHIDDYYSASLYESDVIALLNTHFKDHDHALMSGGSMMYIDAVCDGIDDIPTVDAETRQLMKCRLENEGLPKLVEELKTLDYAHWNVVDKNNPRRVVHALEICHMTGKPYSSFLNKTKTPRNFNVVKIGLTMKREDLYDRINRRVDAMIANGLIEEARKVFPKKGVNALNTVGYKELFEYFEGNMTLDEAVERIKGNTRKYCRKQLTWFKRDGRTRWFSPNDIEGIIEYADSFQ